MLLKPSLQQVNTGEYIIATAFICYNRPIEAAAAAATTFCQRYYATLATAAGLVLFWSSVCYDVCHLTAPLAASEGDHLCFSGRSMFFFLLMRLLSNGRTDFF